MDIKKLKEEIHKESYKSDPRSLIDVIEVDTLIDIIDELQAKNNEVLYLGSGLLPIGTKVTILDSPDFGLDAGNVKTITGYCEWKNKQNGGYECDDVGIYFIGDFQEYQ